MNKELTLRDFRTANVTRCNYVFHSLESWEPNDWATALAGEVGELCNLLKKMKRGEKIPTQDLADECADVFTYLDLLAARLGINLEHAVVDKFNEVSDKKRSDIKL